MGKSKQTDSLIKQDVPKYMCLSGNTQFELAQSIDAAMASAEREVKSNQEDESLCIWYEQILDGIYEEFSIQRPPGMISSLFMLKNAISELTPLCWVNFQALLDEQETPANLTMGRAFEQVMIRLLEVSFVNALDILHARNMWRFDTQRAMQETQKQMIDGIGRQFV